MPTIKRVLTRAEKLVHLDRAKRMRAQGVDIHPRQEWEERLNFLDVTVAGGCATTAFDLPGGNAAFAILVRLYGRGRGTILDCEMVTDWDDQIVLEGFFDEGNPHCQLGRVDYPRSEVLNHRIMESLRFDHGRMVEGFVLFSGLKPMPEGCRHGSLVPFSLIWRNHRETELRQDAELFVDRDLRANSCVR